MMMRDLMYNMTNEDLLGKIDNEGPEYFFLDYIDVHSIQDEDLRKNVQALRLAWEEILSVIDELEEEFYDEGEL
jgi:hypothetical protein